MTSPSTSVEATYSQSDYNGVGVSCNGFTDGFIDVSVQGGIPNYSYLWDTGDITEDLTNIGADTYVVIVSDGNFCTDTATIVVTEPAA